MRTRIKEFRAREGLTQEALAKEVGVRRETIVFLEKGKYNPSLRLGWEIARVLKAEIGELFDFSDYRIDRGERVRKARKKKEIDLADLGDIF